MYACVCVRPLKAAASATLAYVAHYALSSDESLRGPGLVWAGRRSRVARLPNPEVQAGDRKRTFVNYSNTTTIKGKRVKLHD